MMSRPAQSNNTDKAVLLWDEGHVYRWENEKNESLTPIASLKELPKVSQILQLVNHSILVLSAKSNTISYVHLHNQTAEVLLCNEEGCCSQSDSERCHQQSNSSQIGGISLNSQDHGSVFFSDNAAIKKFRIDNSLIQPEVVVDLLNHVDRPGDIMKFTFNEDYSIIFLLWERLDNEDRLLYRYNIYGKKISGEIKMQERELAEISSVNENIILGLDNIQKQLVALDFESNSTSRVCLDNATAGSPGYSDEDDNSLECNTDPHSIKMMTQDDNYIYAMDSSANSILVIDNIKGLCIKIDNASSNRLVISCANFNIFLILEGGSAGKNLISLSFGIMQPYGLGGRLTSRLA